ncbi:PB1 domain [Dillenia turbinata]|uniref:PB1 domain n=1 Tax=Dillenia turbinata TaxID=194707 RepID=A0AAN8ZA56_9MAGN
MDAIPPPPPKLRLMCSYGGRIIPRPHDKTLRYIGGDTKLISLDRRTTSLSSLFSHLSSTFFPNSSTASLSLFSLKYQLPHEDLDSLISITTDEDLRIMLEEYDQIKSSSSSRIRLFLFPTSTSPSSCMGLGVEKCENWFLGVENQRSGGGDLCSLAESQVLETTSSFGSTSSSLSVSNLPPIVEDSFVKLQDKRVVSTASDAFPSGSIVQPQIAQIAVHQDADVVAATTDDKILSSPVGSESNVSESSGLQLHKTVQVPAQQSSQQQQQEMLFIPQYLPHYQMSSLPIPCYHSSYHPQPHQQPQIHYQPTQPYPIYLVPVMPAQPQNQSMNPSLMDAAFLSPNQPLVCPGASIIAPSVGYNEAKTDAYMAEFGKKVYQTVRPASPFEQATSNKSNQVTMDAPELIPGLHSATVASAENDVFGKELDNDPALAQIYKSQPPAPALSQYQTMTGASTVLLAEALGKMQTDNSKQQIRTSQPQ